MTCVIGKTRPTTLYEQKELLGEPHGGFTHGRYTMKRVGDRLVPKSPEAILAEEIAQEKATEFESREIIMCGSGMTAQGVCPCGYFADLLCDYPMGKGKTCDAPMCPDCAYEVGEDRHLCLIHFGQYKGAARVNPWPPKGGAE